MANDKESKKEYLRYPNGPASNQMMNVVSHSDQLEEFQKRLGATSHSSTIEIYVPKDGSESNRQVIYKTDNTETTIQLANIDLFSKSKKPLKKILTYTLVKLSQINIVEGQSNDITISFPLQDFVDLGSYKNLITARQAFNQAMNPLTSIKLSGLVKDRKEQHKITDSEIEVLFTGAKIKKGIIEIYLNKRINWKLFALQYFSILPKTYFSLSDNAADSLLNISILARKRISEIKKNGFFTLSFRSLQQILSLPSEEKTKNPGRDIKDAILNALSEVNENNQDEMNIESVYNPNGNIIQFLNEGYAKITLKNEFGNYFVTLAEKKTEKIESSIKKHDEIVTRAKIKAMAGKMENEMNTENDQDE